ncbi:HAD-like domain-containing protein [Myxozyma melibiosi]|uniref:HAD-like domain-containing protein n=1 Tax=Myxozyma melibiosi TaxID=54550 RepID=A0ABR1EYD9_9ASCO
MSVDVLAANKNIWPFNRFTPEDLALARPLSESKFDAVLVFNDPRDWGCDTQVIVDVLASDEGVYGTRSSGLKQTVPIYFSNDDLLWANEYPLPRFGQGAFRRGIETIFREYTGSEMQSTIIGKPYLFTYEYAHSVLNDWRRHAFGYTQDVHRVYMVGDNPASDIRGGNSYGWSTLLVRSGVYKDGDVLDSRSKPTAVVDNVLAAVMQAIEFEQEHRLRK